jgi:hypothetical protein
MTDRSRAIDIAVSMFLVLFVLLFAFRLFDFSIKPFEDAAILMRYADHLAQGHGIVWNIGEAPVDGATDFLFMVLIAGLAKIGVSVESAVRYTGFLSHILTVLVVYCGLRSLYRTRIWLALVCALYCAVGPGLYYVAAYFGTPFFALFASVTWYVALMIIRDGETHPKAALFATASLLTALVRPEGVILSGLMLVAIVYVRGLKKSPLAIGYYLGVFGIAGGAYFIWRWRYFGYPLPNAFYKKRGGHFYFDSLKRSYLNLIKLCLPFLPLFIAGLYTRRTRRLTVAFALPIIGFASAFVLLSNEMNFGARFQYALMPIVLLSWPPLLAGIKEDIRLPVWPELNRRKRFMIVALGVALALGVLGFQNRVGRGGKRYHDGRYDVAMMLAEYRDQNYTIATTESGLLPFYSRWRAFDTWGLSDQWIAHYNGITSQYLESRNPHLIVFHERSAPLSQPSSRTIEWNDMIDTLRDYAQHNDYVLAAVFGDSPHDTHSYFVRRDFADSQEIAERIRTFDYSWYKSGQRAVNWVQDQPRSPNRSISED